VNCIGEEDRNKGRAYKRGKSPCRPIGSREGCVPDRATTGRNRPGRVQPRDRLGWQSFQGPTSIE